MQSCEFCAIASGESPAEVIFENEATLAFFPLSPATAGHTLVIPKRHVPDFLAPEVDASFLDLTRAVLRVGRAVRDALSPEGMNLISSAGEAATQSVFHLHVHLVPRWRHDRIGRIWPAERRISEECKDDWADLIRAALARQIPTA